MYGQLQKWKGTDCANDEVSAVTQTTQRPWESRPTRMLLLQVRSVCSGLHLRFPPDNEVKYSFVLRLDKISIDCPTVGEMNGITAANSKAPFKIQGKHAKFTNTNQIL